MSSTASLLQQFKTQLPYYIQLTRIDRPIGIYLLMWPTLWALWFAAKGIPNVSTLIIFILGVILMRSAGCVINDYADRNWDGKVKRTQHRPLATGKVSEKEALLLFFFLCLISFILVLCTNRLTILLSIGGVFLAVIYPFMKRHTHLPQIFLGAAFSWAIPMAWAAQSGEISRIVWLIYTANLLWTVAYDTEYAMVDRDDDIKVGIKSTAILFGYADRAIIFTLQAFTILVMYLVGKQSDMGVFYNLGLLVAASLFCWQQHMIRYRERDACLNAFLHNHWAGMAIFMGIAADFALR